MIVEINKRRSLHSEADNMPELEVQLSVFFTEKLPVWRQLGVV